MVTKLRVLLIDDHPIIIDSYTRVLNYISETHPNYEFTIRAANDCDSANTIIEEAVTGIPFDLVFLDIRLPPSETNKLLSGEDIGIKIRNLFKDAKIMVFTSYNDNYRLSNILKTVNPDAFLVKDDVAFDTLTEAIESIIQDPPFYSKTIMRLMRRNISNDFILDKIDRTLLYYLSNGSKMRELTNVLPLSRAGIDRRKRKLKDMFNVDHKEDTQLIQKAREMGFI